MWDWFLAMGGSLSTPGKYDIMNAYEWFVDQAYLQMTATVDPDGMTHVTIDQVAWGSTNLLNRMLYWGSTSYLASHLDSTAAAGWSGMEPYAWFEGLSYTGSFSASDFDFELSAVMPYGFQHDARPGPDGNFDRVDDFSVWKWNPILHDYLNDFLGHNASELDRYPGGTVRDVVPGSSSYGTFVSRDVVPVTWDLGAGETWTFEFPTGDVVFYDPNLTPPGATPNSNDFVEIIAPLGLHSTKPAFYGTFDSVAKIWTVVGPTVTGGPDGSPGNYPLESWGAISLGVEQPILVPALHWRGSFAILIGLLASLALCSLSPALRALLPSTDPGQEQGHGEQEPGDDR
jgi:hypothetical protein